MEKTTSADFQILIDELSLLRKNISPKVTFFRASLNRVNKEMEFWNGPARRARSRNGSFFNKEIAELRPSNQTPNVTQVSPVEYCLLP